MKKIISLFICLISLIWTGLAHTQEATPKRIALVPLALYAPENYQYLKNGIYSMFVTRLFWENKVEVIERSVIEEALKRLKIKGIPTQVQAERLGKMLQADYVLYGSVTILGKEASIDVKLLDIEKKKVYPFFHQCHDPGDIINGVNIIAMSINDQIFGRKMPVLEAKPKTPPPPSAPNASFAPQGTYFPEQKGLRKWYSYPLSFAARGLAIGDVNGDGKNELVLIDNNTIWIYQYIKGHLNLLKKVETIPSNLFVNVGLYDLNHDGKQEIIITNYPRRRVATVVYSWQENKLVKIAKDIPWYVKVQIGPNGKKTILGQREGINGPFRPGIYRLRWTGKKFEATERICSINKAMIFNCLFADVTGDELKDVILLDEEDYLTLLTTTGSKEWKSSEHYYGSVFYIEGKFIDPDAFNPRLERIYIPGRILVAELNHKPPLELIVYQNHSRFGRILRDFKNFSNGEFKILGWDGLGMKLMWQSPKIHGCISDCYLGDFDNDGHKELVFTMIRNYRSVLFSKSRTIIVAYDLGVIHLK